MRWDLSPVCRAWLLLLSFLAVTADVRADLFEYVKKPEPNASWKHVNERDFLGAKVFQLELVSQVWHDVTWKHDLIIVLPAKVKPTATMLLWNQGGKVSLSSTAFALDLARKTQSPVAFLYGIPNQPLFGKLKEDALIAETFVRYLKTKDDTWPLLFPMTKSLVKAMDALQEFARDKWKVEVKQFVVSGASKRGWTTWLTGAADPRVKAIVPMVIDTLNMQKQLPYQLKSYGAYSDMIRDYIRRDLVPPPKTPEGLKLWSMVDPWVYRNRVKMPKMIINGSNDPYWTQDALNLYWDDLVGDKWISYVPNAGHNLAQKGEGGKSDLSRVSGTFAAFAKSQIHGKPWPKLTWKHGRANGKYLVSVTSDAAPKAARVWQADAATRDFRKATWEEHKVTLEKGNVAAEVDPPASGYRVFFVECEYEMDGLRYFLTTQVRIIEAAGK